MAARKSCTHLTWSEAKSKSGVGGSSGNKKNKEQLRKQDHGQVLAAKIIAKQGGGVADAENKKLAKAYRKQEEKAAAIAAQRAEEREMKRLASLQEVRPYDKAKDKITELLQQMREDPTDDNKTNDNIPSIQQFEAGIDFDNEETLAQILECKQMQVDEILALQAMIPEEDFVISHASKLEELKELLESGDDDGDVTRNKSIAKHPPISYLIKLEVDDYRESCSGGDDNDQEKMDLNALILLRVTLPPLYLNSEGSQIPLWEVEYLMVTDKNAMCSNDKPLESLAWLDTKAMQDAMSQQAQEDLLPYPCVYEVAVTWLSENMYQYLNMHPHLLHVLAAK